MRPLELRLSGFRSYRSERVVSFRDLDLVAIIGDTGAGKSSLLEAMTWALYGASTWSKRASSELLAHGARRMSVSLEFEAAGGVWRVVRAYGSANTAVLECLSDPSVAKIDGARQVDPEIERLLGLPYDVFCSCVLLPQGKFERLLKATPGQKTDVLKSILRLESLGLMRERADGLARRLGDREREMLTARARFMPSPLAIAEAAAEQLAALEPERSRLSALAEEVARLGASSREHLERARAAETEAARLVIRRGDRSTQLHALALAAAALGDQADAARLALADAERVRDDAETAYRAAVDAGLDAPSLTAAAGRVTAARAVLRRSDQLAARIADDERALTAIGDELDAARSASSVAEAALRAHDETRAREQAEATAATDRARELADHAKRVGEAVDARDRAAAALATARATAERSAAAHASARRALDAARVDLDAALAAREAAQRAHAVAHVAAGAAPGDPCPVCARALPDEFEPPLAADLAEAETAVGATTREHDAAAASERTAALSAERDATAQRAAESTLATTTEAATTALAAAAPAVAAAGSRDETPVAGAAAGPRDELPVAGGAAGLRDEGGGAGGAVTSPRHEVGDPALTLWRDDDAGAARPREVTADDVSRAAEAAAGEADEIAARVAALDVARPGIERARADAQRGAAEVESRAKALDRGLAERRADLELAAAELADHVAALPAFCRAASAGGHHAAGGGDAAGGHRAAGGGDAAGGHRAAGGGDAAGGHHAAGGGDAAGGHHAAAGGDVAALDLADAAIADRLEAARALEATRAQAQRAAGEAGEVVRAFELRLEREIVTPVAEHRAHLHALCGELPGAAEPGAAMAVDALAVYASELELEIDARVRALTREVEEHREAEVVERVAAAQLIEEGGFAEPAALEERLVLVRAEAIAATREHEAARAQIEPAGRLDDLLAKATELRLGFEALREALADRGFVGFVVARRQRALLQHASRVLQDITGRYAFTDDFQILDNESGLPRSPDTLSGGETFIASLALALGLVEVADRSGGDLRALFLDEGFGTLDAAILDTALNALEQRAKAGRLIGLISHVPTVAERIDTVLEVRSDVGGSSVHVLGREEREDRVMEAIQDTLDA
ncbi:AAA family ATPase [Solirubrobacter soli]|uniref:AAA family ATPase n=1 Tax=Solirubrobacter soli TaxID=363832 RepID=UPI00041E98D7|nr:AAA family ATPase [Solirubrobacter soli]